jgi:Fe-S cluster assembly iron-binding protein IscA
MALDESTTNDQIFEEQGVTYVVDKELFEQVKPIGIDFITTPRGSGFKLTSSMSADSACGSSCSC